MRGAFHHTRAEIDRALALLAAGEVDWRALAGDVVGLDDLAGALRRADGGRGAQARGGTGAMRLALALALSAPSPRRPPRAPPARRFPLPRPPTARPAPPRSTPTSAPWHAPRRSIRTRRRRLQRPGPAAALRDRLGPAHDRLRAAFARLRAVRAGHARSAGDAPAVVWVAGTVHGNEPSGADADLRLLRDLAGRCDDPLLRRVVVVVLPDQNPDGRELRTPSTPPASTSTATGWR